MIDDFLIRAIVCGIFISIIACPIGCVIVWKRMAYFGETIAHSALLGIAAGIFFEMNTIIAIISVAALLSVVLTLFYDLDIYHNDNLLGIIAPSILALGMIFYGMIENIRVDLVSYLIGDILLISYNDIFIIAGLSILSATWLYFLWKPLMLVIISKELAVVKGINVKLVRLQFMLLISLVISVSVKVTGILTITALLIIPVSSARLISKSPKQMVLHSIFIGVLSIMLGIILSYYYNLSSGPAIVVAMLTIFLGMLSLRRNV